METLRRLLVVLLLCAVAQPVLAAKTPKPKSNPAGEELARLVYDRPGGDDSAALVAMRLAKKGDQPRERWLYSYAKEKGGGERWSMMRFIHPEDIDGTALLTQDHPGDDSDQWLYLPALDRVRRISSSRKGGRFVGSDFFYEDLQDREVEMDYHYLQGTGKVGGVPCEVLISTPRDRKNSVYGKRVSCVHRKTLIPLSVDLYKRGRDKPSKRLRARKIKKVQGYWTVLDSTMYDLKSGHQTQLFTKKIQYDQKLPDELFTKRALADDQMERKFRP